MTPLTILVGFQSDTVMIYIVDNQPEITVVNKLPIIIIGKPNHILMMSSQHL